MHLSTVGQLAHPAEDGGRRSDRHRGRIVTNGHGLPGREQSDNGGVRPYESGVEGGETLGKRSDLCKGIFRSTAMNSLWCHFICSYGHCNIAMSRF